MARGVNKVILVGNLGADPETRSMPSGMTVTNIRIATSESWKDKASGAQQERTEWHSIALFGRLGEIAAEYLRKGRRCSSRASCEPENGRTSRETIDLPPKSSPTICKCWAAARGGGGGATGGERGAAGRGRQCAAAG